MALLLVKHSAVETAMDYLLDDLASLDSELVKFEQYFKKQWINTVPSKYWNLGAVHLRCNNSLEGSEFYLEYMIYFLLFRL